MPGSCFHWLKLPKMNKPGHLWVFHYVRISYLLQLWERALKYGKQQVSVPLFNMCSKLLLNCTNEYLNLQQAFKPENTEISRQEQLGAHTGSGLSSHDSRHLAAEGNPAALWMVTDRKAQHEGFPRKLRSRKSNPLILFNMKVKTASALSFRKS